MWIPQVVSYTSFFNSLLRKIVFTSICHISQKQYAAIPRRILIPLSIATREKFDIIYTFLLTISLGNKVSFVGLYLFICSMWHPLPRHTYLYNKIHENTELHKMKFYSTNLKEFTWVKGSRSSQDLNTNNIRGVSYHIPI